MSPRGEPTRLADRRGATIDKKTASPAKGACLHAPGPALSNRVPPPTESRLDCWQMTLLSLQMLPQPLSRIACGQWLRWGRYFSMCPDSGRMTTDRVWVAMAPTLKGDVKASMGDVNSP